MLDILSIVVYICGIGLKVFKTLVVGRTPKPNSFHSYPLTKSSANCNHRHTAFRNLKLNLDLDLVAVQIIDFLFDLVEGLKGEAYMFSEFEASILFPCLVEKVFIILHLVCGFQSS